jgi:peptide deformylase
MILPIYTYGQPVLRKETETIEKDYPKIRELVTDMFETMNKADGVGLAAPQVGFPIRLFVIDANTITKTYPECKDFKRVMINPEILSQSDETISLEEGCLSFPGIHEKVPRAVNIQVEYFDANFMKQKETLEGFNARIVQHECDHLQGLVFIDSISPIRRQLNKGKLNNLIKGKTNCNYKVKTIKV